jgi:hypothetical protein
MLAAGASPTIGGQTLGLLIEIDSQSQKVLVYNHTWAHTGVWKVVKSGFPLAFV